MRTTPAIDGPKITQMKYMNGTDTEPSLASIKEQGQTEYLLGLFSYLYNLILSSVTYTVVIRLLRCINGL